MSDPLINDENSLIDENLLESRDPIDEDLEVDGDEGEESPSESIMMDEGGMNMDDKLDEDFMEGGDESFTLDSL